jgi:hypothetical protein
MGRRLFAFCVAALFGLLATAGVATSASAAGLPCGNTCDGKNPQTYRIQLSTKDPDLYVICAWDATTKRSATLGTYKLELRYSPRCETTWLRLTDLGTGTLYPYKVKQVSKYTSGSVRKTIWGGFFPDGNWTSMLNDHNLLNYGCIYTYFNEYDIERDKVYQSKCTGSY